MIRRPLSVKADAKIGWIQGYTVLETNDFAARLKNDQNGTTDWVHRAHVKKIVPRPPHLLDDDSDDDSSDDEESDFSKSLNDSSSSGEVVKKSLTEDDLRKLFEDVQARTMNQSRTSSRSSKSGRSKRKREELVEIRRTDSRPKRHRTQTQRLNIGDTKAKSYK